MKMRYTLLAMLISASIASQAICSQDVDDSDLLGIQYFEGADEDFKINSGSCRDNGEMEERSKTNENLSDWES